MVMDFSGNAGAASSFDILPDGQLAWAILNVRGVKASGSGGGYLDCELTIAEGQPFAGRKLWEMIGDPNNAGNSEKYRQMGAVAITRILEAGRGAGPNNRAAYQINAYSDLDGLKVAIKVGVEAGTGGHEDKNRVAEWLTPNPDSQSGHKWFKKLMEGVYNAKASTASTTGNGQGGFGAPAGGGFGGTTGGFGGSAPAATPQQNGFGGASQPGFTQGPAEASGHGVINAANGSSTTGAAASPSNPGATPGWLSQAGPQS